MSKYTKRKKYSVPLIFFLYDLYMKMIKRRSIGCGLVLCFREYVNEDIIWRLIVSDIKESLDD